MQPLYPHPMSLLLGEAGFALCDALSAYTLPHYVMGVCTTGVRVQFLTPLTREDLDLVERVALDYIGRRYVSIRWREARRASV